jgi:hypothetical protein
MTQRSTVIAFGSFVVVLILTLWPVIRVHQLEADFRKVKLGDRRALVLKQMGKPWKDGQCGYLINSSPDCVEELIYAHPYAPLLPAYWVVSLNRDNQVIGSYYTTSP